MKNKVTASITSKGMKSDEMSFYRKIVSAYAPGQWIQLPRPFLHFLNRDEAIALSALFDKADRLIARERIPNGWFYYTMEDMEIDTGMDRNVQQRVINSLIKKRIIQKERRGIPAKRHFKLMVDKINDLVTEAVEHIDEQKRRMHKNERKALKQKLIEELEDDGD